MMCVEIQHERSSYLAACWVGKTKTGLHKINNTSSKWCKTTLRALKRNPIDKTHWVTKQSDRLTAVLIQMKQPSRMFLTPVLWDCCKENETTEARDRRSKSSKERRRGRRGARGAGLEMWRVKRWWVRSDRRESGSSVRWEQRWPL